MQNAPAVRRGQSYGSLFVRRAPSASAFRRERVTESRRMRHDYVIARGASRAVENGAHSSGI